MNTLLPQKATDFFIQNRGCHPGIVLKYLLEELGMSQRQLAKIIDRPYQAVNEIVRGKKQVTAETALQFETALLGSAHFWMDIQINHDILVACKKKCR